MVSAEAVFEFMKIRLFLVSILVSGLLVTSLRAQTDDQESPSEKNPKAVELIKQAILLEDSKQFARAIAKYEEVLKLEPKDFAAMATIAGLYGKMEMPKEEVIWAKKAIDTNPKFYQAHINHGNGLAMQGLFSDALKSYDAAAKLAPTNPLPVYSMGVVAEEQRDLPKALTYYKRSIELDPKFEDGLFSAAAMHANLKQFAEAKALLKKLLEMNPKDEDARQMLAQIEREKQ